MTPGLRQAAVFAFFAAWLAAGLLSPGGARAEDGALQTEIVTDAIYKGVVGKALDALPMDPEQRVALQRTNAVVSGTMTGRSISIWVGLTNPVLMIGGLVWGIFAAANIKSDEPKPSAIATALASPGHIEVQPLDSVEPGVALQLATDAPDRGSFEMEAGAPVASATRPLRLSMDLSAIPVPESTQGEDAGMTAGLAANF